MKIVLRLISERKIKCFYIINCPLVIVCLTLFAIAQGCQPNYENTLSLISKGITPVILDDENFIGFHVTTRPHNRKVIYHATSGYWFVFYGHGRKDPDGVFRTSWRSSKDGINWSRRHTAYEGNAHSSSLDVLLSGNKITALIYRPQYHREKAGIPFLRDGKLWYQRQDDFPLPYEIQQYRTDNGRLLSDTIYSVMRGSFFNAFAHYGSLTQDSEGFFWVGARAVINKEKRPFQAWVARSSKENDISAWGPHHILFKASSKGTITVQVIALDDARVFAVIFSKSDAKVYGSLYDPSAGKWESPYVISEGNSRSKRAVTSFDPGTKRLHLVYINNSGALMHKILSTPYREQDWKPQAGNESRGIMIVSNVIAKPEKDDNISLSIDTSKTPAPLVVAYHKDTPHYYLRRYNGKAWEKKDFPIGIHKSNQYVDEISLIRDFSERLGLIYYVLPNKKQYQKGELHFLEIPKDIFKSD